MIAKLLEDIDFCLEEQVDLTYQLINSANQWYPIAKNHILNETNDFSSYLTIIYLIGKNVFGLSFELDSDAEHGYGMRLNALTFEIIEYGSGEIAFS